MKKKKRLCFPTIRQHAQCEKKLFSLLLTSDIDLIRFDLNSVIASLIGFYDVLVFSLLCYSFQPTFSLV